MCCKHKIVNIVYIISGKIFTGQFNNVSRELVGITVSVSHLICHN